LLLYLIFSFFLSCLVQQIPRHSVQDPPDWGNILDAKIPAVDGGILKVWRIEPEQPSRSTVGFAQGWSRNRDRMVARTRYFGCWGFTTAIHSARDHGQSSPEDS